MLVVSDFLSPLLKSLSHKTKSLRCYDGDEGASAAMSSMLFGFSRFFHVFLADIVIS